MKLWNLKSDNSLYFLSFVIFQGPAGTRGPEGRQGEKGTKVSVELCGTFFKLPLVLKS